MNLRIQSIFSPGRGGGRDRGREGAVKNPITAYKAVVKKKKKKKKKKRKKKKKENKRSGGGGS